MTGDKEDHPILVIQPVDRLGRPVEKDLLDAAQHNWKRVIAYAERQGQDGSVAAGELEATVHRLSWVGKRHPGFRGKIKNLEHYVFVVTVHRLDRLAAKEAAVEYVGSLDDLDLLRGTQDSTCVSRLEDEVVLKEVVGYLNEQTRRLFAMRRAGYSWEEIAGSLGTSSVSVRSQFSRGVARARKRIMGQLSAKATPESGRSE